MSQSRGKSEDELKWRFDSSASKRYAKQMNPIDKSSTEDRPPLSGVKEEGAMDCPGVFRTHLQDPKAECKRLMRLAALNPELRFWALGGTGDILESDEEVQDCSSGGTVRRPFFARASAVSAFAPLTGDAVPEPRLIGNYPELIVHHCYAGGDGPLPRSRPADEAGTCAGEGAVLEQMEVHPHSTDDLLGPRAGNVEESEVPSDCSMGATGDQDPQVPTDGDDEDSQDATDDADLHQEQEDIARGHTAETLNLVPEAAGVGVESKEPRDFPISATNVTDDLDFQEASDDLNPWEEEEIRKDEDTAGNALHTSCARDDLMPDEAGDCPAAGTNRTPVSIVLRRRLAWRTDKAIVPCKRSMVDEKMKDEAYVRRYYTCGVRDTVLGCMILVPVLFLVLLPRLPLPNISIDDPIAVVWRVSLYVCAQFFLLILCTQTTGNIFSTLYRLSYGPLLVFTITHFFSPAVGMGIIHLSTAWAAGMFGYSFSRYRQHIGTEQAADLALTLTPTGLSKKMMRQRIDLLIHSIFCCSLISLCGSALVLWLVFWTTCEDIYFVVAGISFLIFWMLYFWAFVVTKLCLHEALISLDSMMHIPLYQLAFNVCSVVCFLISKALWTYFFGLQMMTMSGFMGYALAIRAHYHELLLVHGRKKTAITTRVVLIPSEGDANGRRESS